MKEVYRDPDPVRVGLFRSLLESRGIATQVENDHENDALGIQRMGPPRLDPVLCVIDEADYETALELLRENREVMDKLAEYLIEKETITGKEFMEIFREMTGQTEESETKAEEKPEAEPVELAKEPEEKPETEPVD